MGRREEREEIQSTWMVSREPPNRDGSRHERRARLAKMKRERTFYGMARIAFPDREVKK